VLARVLDAPSDERPPLALRALLKWANKEDMPLVVASRRFASQSRSGVADTLAGPTGERNVYSLVPRQAVLCLADSEQDLLLQLAAVLSVDSRAVWPASAQLLFHRLPAEVQARIALASDWSAPNVAFDAVLLHGGVEQLARRAAAAGAAAGPIVGVERLAPGETAIPLERLVVERSLSVNTAAAGGNASLMTIG
jgi:RHH-type proline utilization regulon transcriptional repressor/proline dehydrogenase/delta 1-pyrroline-5-carboxylate dehydrogenase